jgi:hypothetical protein
VEDRVAALHRSFKCVAVFEVALDPADVLCQVADVAGCLGMAAQRTDAPAALKRRPRDEAADEAGRAQNERRAVVWGNKVRL